MVFTSLVQSVLLQGSETWTPTKADSARLQAFHVKAQRRILNIKWYDFVTNDSVRSQTKLTDLPLIIADRRQLIARTCLPPTTRCASPQHPPALCQPFTGRCPAPDWKRPPGRPRKTWIQQVEEDHGCTINSLWSSAQDRSLWRSLRPWLVRRSSEWVSDGISVCYKPIPASTCSTMAAVHPHIRRQTTGNRGNIPITAPVPNSTLQFQ